MAAMTGGTPPRPYGYSPPNPSVYEPDGQGNYRQIPSHTYGEINGGMPQGNAGNGMGHMGGGLPGNYQSQILNGLLSSVNGSATPPAHTAGGVGGWSPYQSPGHSGINPYTPPQISPIPEAVTHGTNAGAPQHPTMPGQINFASGPSADQLKSNNDAVYARAKDDAGNTARAALTGLTGELQGRGMGGAGYEAGQIGSTVSRAANTIGEASRQNAQTQYDQALARANMQDQLNVTQRGQDISSLNSMYGNDIGAFTASRGQDLGASTAARGQDLSLASAKYGTDASSALTARGQDLGKYSTDVNAGVAAAGHSLTARGQDISKYGIDTSAEEATNALAQQKQLANQQALLGLLKGIY